jgi:hypothetical protein
MLSSERRRVCRCKGYNLGWYDESRDGLPYVDPIGICTLACDSTLPCAKDEIVSISGMHPDMSLYFNISGYKMNYKCRYICAHYLGLTVTERSVSTFRRFDPKSSE